ncbi:MAG: class I SAM-dependent methyltransferase, partial [Bdellovibrionales bacterium]|nr:class I SAM-dependent methyltransferase [Bdellovibrionales bacterium]
MTAETGEAQAWHLRLFEKSVLKQQKLRELLGAMSRLGISADRSSLRALDLGSDNGVISYLLRERGGRWASGDLSNETVSSIKALVEHDVSLVSGDALPYPDEEFDLVVVVDMLEHVDNDAALIGEIARVLKPDGALIVNVPNRKSYS